MLSQTKGTWAELDWSARGRKISQSLGFPKGFWKLCPTKPPRHTHPNGSYPLSVLSRRQTLLGPLSVAWAVPLDSVSAQPSSLPRPQPPPWAMLQGPGFSC